MSLATVIPMPVTLMVISHTGRPGKDADGALGLYWLLGISVLKNESNDDSTSSFSLLLHYQMGGDKVSCLVVSLFE